MKLLAYVVLVGVLWLGVIPTHEFGHCLLYWLSGGDGECVTAFQASYSAESGLAVSLRGYEPSRVEAIAHHVAVYTLNVIQAILLPIAFWPGRRA